MKWEYKFRLVSYDLLHMMSVELSKEGNEGWEAVSMTPKFEGYLVLLKRPLPE
jgi:hypothetical protein